MSLWPLYSLGQTSSSSAQPLCIVAVLTGKLTEYAPSVDLGFQEIRRVGSAPLWLNGAKQRGPSRLGRLGPQVQCVRVARRCTEMG
jgi:hypothetical protein